MTRDEIIARAEKFTQSGAGNYVSAEKALKESYVGMKIFENPIFAFGPADDEIYEKFKDPDVIGPHFLPPDQWLSGAKTVISFFLPFTGRIKAANAENFDWPAEEWLHGRIEGQAFLKELALDLHKFLTDAGYASIIPSFDSRFKSGGPKNDAEGERNMFTSNWSERHTAYACGLGTFGLSKGLITKKGVCGRFGSILTVLDVEKDVRPYKDVYEYCSMCKACIPNCPAKAISETGKDDALCKAFLDRTLSKHNPRYGCGKCQVNLPCESRKSRTNLL